MDINQLRTLLHVAELGSLSRAAERLRIAQPALSRQVRLLEEELGARLFDRHGRGMTPTEKGREALRHAQRVMAELEEIRAAVADEDAALRGHVSVGMPPTVSAILARPLVAAFSARHPDATLRIVDAYTGYLRDWLHRGELHLAIMYQSPPARSLRVTPLLEERLHLVGPPGAGLSPARPVTAAEVAARRLFLPSPGHGLRALVEAWAEAAGVALDVRVEADSYAILTALAEAGPGCTLLPLAPIRREIAAGRLAHAPIADPAPRRRLELAMPADRAAPRLARFAAQALRDIAGDLVRGGQWSGRLIGGGEPDPAGGAAS